MSFSRIAPLSIQATLSHGEAGRDPLFDAWEALREARAEPFDRGDPGRWQERFTDSVARAGAAIRDHVQEVEGERSPLRWAARATAGGQAVMRQFAEHVPLRQKVDKVLADLRALRTVALPRVIDLSEQVVELEIAVARHHNRLREILGAVDEPGQPLPVARPVAPVLRRAP